MLKYHEIYPLENAANKIEEELDYLLQAKPRMYKITKDRYRQLAEQLLESVEKISKLLEEDALVSDSLDEFDELSDSSIQDNNLILRSKLEHTSQVVNSAEEFTNSNRITIQHDSDNSNSSSVSIDKLDYGAIIHSYAQVINDAANSSNANYVEVKECAELIRDWFNCRFVLHVDNFKYNIRQMPVWISNIIILCGKYQSQGRYRDLVNRFNKWMEDVEDNKNNKWAVPYEVLQLSKQPKPEDFTTHAIVLNDLLFSQFYYRLTTYSDTNLKISLSTDQVISCIKENNPSLIPIIRTRVARRAELISDCKLHPLEE